jgi:hypothetical protein
MMRMTPFELLLAVALTACAGGPAAEEEAGPRASQGGRLKPAAPLRCPPDELTSHQGLVVRYHRSSSSAGLVIDTDDGTTESLSLTYPPEREMDWFLLEGSAMEAEDWGRVEVRQGELLPGMRVIAWVCSDGTVVIDWRPPPD